jgi:hypothetical protein
MLNAGVALFGGLWQHPVTAVVALPAVSAALSLCLCRLSRMSIRWTLGVVAGCVTFCLIATACAVLMGAIASFYSGF